MNVYRLVCALTGLLMFSSGAGAANWDNALSASTRLSYTDNVSLSPAATRRDEMISEFNVGATINAVGAQLSTNTRFNSQLLHFFNKTSEDRQFYQLDSVTSVAPIKDKLGFETRISHSQQTVDTAQAAPTNNLAVSNNRTDVTTLSEIISVNQRFASYANLSSTLEISNVKTGGGTADGNTTALAVDVVSGLEFQRLRWSMSVTSQQDKVANTEVSTASAGVSLSVMDHLSLTADLRVAEDNLVGNSSSASDGVWNMGVAWNRAQGRTASFSLGNGGVWNAAMDWAISRRQTLSFTLGNLDVAQNYGLSWNLLRARGQVSADYTESRQTVRQLQAARLIFDESGQVILGIQLPTLTDDSFIQRVLTLSLSESHGKSTYTASLSRELRKFDQAGNADSVSTLRGTWGLTISPRSTSTLSASFIDQNLSGGQNQDTLLSLNWALAYQVRDNISASLRIDHSSKSSNVANTNFEANTITLGLTANF